VLRTTPIVSVKSRSYPSDFCGVELKGKSTDPNQEHLMKWNKKFEILSQLFFFYFLRKFFRPVSSKLYEVVSYEL